MPRDLTALSKTTGEPVGARDIRALLSTIAVAADRPLRWRLGATVTILAVASLLNALVPMLFAAAIDRLQPAATLAIAPLALILAYVGLQWTARLLNEARWALYGPIEQRLRRRMALRTLDHLHALSLRFHLARRTGQVSRILDNGLNALRELLFDAVFLILPFLAEILFVAVILMVRVDWMFTLILIPTLAAYAFVLIQGSEWLRTHQRRAVVEAATAHGEAIDSLLNYETVKYFGSEQLVADRYDRSLAKVEQFTVRALGFRSLIGFVLVTIIGLGMAAILVIATRRVEAGSMTVGELVLVNAYLLQLVRPMERLGQLYRSIKQSLVDLEQLVELLRQQPEIIDRPDARLLAPGPGEIRFEAVSFDYGDGRGALHGLDLVIRAGTRVALVGPTGAGKSTIARLLFRFYDPHRGRITIDGQDIGAVTQSSLRAAIAVVPQDTVLLNDSIEANIGVGRPDASPEEVRVAADAASLGPFLDALPEGMGTLVGERGLRLSGGEKQRVAIARAILKKPRILILDEATSALDSATESMVRTSLDELFLGSTTLVIAHRLSTIVDADLILVLDEGRIAERGHHEALLTEDGLYARLWRHQTETGEGI